MTEQRTVTVLGAGLAGCLMTILLARRGVKVRLLERRPDLRKHRLSAGRSINLALADRGIHALKSAGVYAEVEPLLITMPGRCLHDLNGGTQFVRYGQREHEVIYSVSRPGLNAVLLNHAEQLPGVELQFGVECISLDFSQQRLTVRDHDSSRSSTVNFERLIAADGVNSIARQTLLKTAQGNATTEMLTHGYKELTLPADTNGQHQMERQALHIWPRGGFMLIALPNLDGSFTVTLFLPFDSSPENPHSFASLHDAIGIERFFQQYFADALALMPNLAREFLEHPTGKMNTVRSSRWANANAALIGDAAHAIVPFHGQGMNCAFEDCLELDMLLQQHPFSIAGEKFERSRKPNANAIADMALENYIEMRDTVRHPKFLLQKQLAFELERRFPQRFVPRYSMVMFHHEIPYAQAYERGRIQVQILDSLSRDHTELGQIDWQAAATLVETQLAPLE
ncbi:MAG: NAD(P)/FAD-dependent oxidoreductase [Steroidobacteraceae bacterium]